MLPVYVVYQKRKNFCIRKLLQICDQAIEQLRTALHDSYFKDILFILQSF